MTKEVWGLVKGVDVQPDITEKAELKQCARIVIQQQGRYI